MTDFTGSHQYHSIDPTSRQPLMFQHTGFERRAGMMPPDGVEEDACSCHWIQVTRAARQYNQPTPTTAMIVSEPEEEAVYPCQWIQEVSTAMRQWITRVLSLPCFNRDRIEILDRGPQQNSHPAPIFLPQNENSVRSHNRLNQDTSWSDSNVVPLQLFNTTTVRVMPENFCENITREHRSDSVNCSPQRQDYNLFRGDVSTVLENHRQRTRTSFSDPIVSDELPIFTDSQWGELLQEQDHSRTQNFLGFLDKLALHHRSYPQATLVDRLEKIHKTVKKDRQLWDEVLTEAEEGSSTCEDRALHYFCSIENRCLIYRLLNGQPVDDEKMFEVMRALYRREKLQEKVTQLIAQEGERLLSFNQLLGELDEVEIQLYFETQLKDLLGLLGEEMHMRFKEIGKVRGQFLEQVAESIFEDEQTEPSKLRDYIANNRYWREYVEKKCHDELAGFLEQHCHLQEQLDAKSDTGEISSQEYLEKSDELMKNYQKECHNVCEERLEVICPGKSAHRVYAPAA